MCTRGRIEESCGVANGVSAATGDLHARSNFFTNSFQFCVVSYEWSFLFVAIGQENKLAVAVESHVRLWCI
jgi:hypothetical protein